MFQGFPRQNGGRSAKDDDCILHDPHGSFAGDGIGLHIYIYILSMSPVANKHYVFRHLNFKSLKHQALGAEE